MPPLKVYYLDDEPDLCEIFATVFAEPGIEINTFTDSKSLLAAAAEAPPDVLFVDYRLPETNGDRVAQALDPTIPKYLITGDAAVQTTYAFLNVFGKPYDDSEIRMVLHALLAKRNNR